MQFSLRPLLQLSYNVRGVAYDINAVAKKIDDSYSPESTIQFVSGKSLYVFDR